MVKKKKVVKKKKAPKKKTAPKKKGEKAVAKSSFVVKKTPTGKKRALSKNKLITDTVAPVDNKVQSKLPIVEEPSPAVAAADEKENTPAIE